MYTESSYSLDVVKAPCSLTSQRTAWVCFSHLYSSNNNYRSVIPKVIPYCIVNGLVTFLIYHFKDRIDLTSNPSGHKYLAVVRGSLL
jgi:hypothetical protein